MATRLALVYLDMDAPEVEVLANGLRNRGAEVNQIGLPLEADDSRAGKQRMDERLVFFMGQTSAFTAQAHPSLGRLTTGFADLSESIVVLRFPPGTPGAPTIDQRLDHATKIVADSVGDALSKLGSKLRLNIDFALETAGLRDQVVKLRQEFEGREVGAHGKPSAPAPKPYWMIAGLTAILLLGIIALFFPRTKNVQAGTIVAFAGFAVPDGWLLCDGAEVDPDDYGDLARAIGTAWGEGAELAGGRRKIKLPDLRGLFLRGANSGRDDQFADVDVNRAVGGPPQSDAIQRHKHVDAGHHHDRNEKGRGETPIYHAKGTWLPQNVGENNREFNLTESTKRTASAAAKIGDPTEARVDSETRPKNAAVNWIIKY